MLNQIVTQSHNTKQANPFDTFTETEHAEYSAYLDECKAQVPDPEPSDESQSVFDMLTEMYETRESFRTDVDRLAAISRKYDGVRLERCEDTTLVEVDGTIIGHSNDTETISRMIDDYRERQAKRELVRLANGEWVNANPDDVDFLNWLSDRGNGGY